MKDNFKELGEEQLFELDRKSEFLESFETRKYLKLVEELYYTYLMTNIKIKVNTLKTVGLEVLYYDFEDEDEYLNETVIDLSGVQVSKQNLGILLLSNIEVNEIMDEEEAVKSEGLLKIAEHLIFEKEYKNMGKFKI